MSNCNAKNQSRFGCLLAAALMVAAGDVVAAREEVLLNASAGAFYDSNRTLVEGDGNEVNGTHQRARVRYQAATESSSIEGAFNALEQQLPGYEYLENDRLGISLAGNGKFERSNLNSSLSVQRDTTLSTEVQAAGVINENKDRLLSTLAGGYGYLVTERDQLNIGVSAEKVDYDDIRSAQLAEYLFYGVDAGYSRSLNETTRLQFSLYESVLDNDESGLISDTVGFIVNLEQQISPVWHWKAGLGRRESRYEWEMLPGSADDFEGTDRSRVSDFELTYDGETARVKLFGAYDLVPSSGGNLVARRSAGATMLQSWSAVQNTLLSMRYWEQRSDLAIKSGEDLDSLQLTLEHNWRLLRKMNLVFRYSRFDRLLLATDARADSDFVEIEIAWIEDPLSM
ncbi:MAG: hypothetical protein HPY82_03350 [Gammaproteobacteria bacterium]|nr:hypothetical protein [Gammaproteobacteria bacterium]